MMLNAEWAGLAIRSSAATGSARCQGLRIGRNHQRRGARFTRRLRALTENQLANVDRDGLVAVQPLAQRRGVALDARGELVAVEFAAGKRRPQRAGIRDIGLEILDIQPSPRLGLMALSPPILAGTTRGVS
jgi:hypothetical protein